MPLIPGLPAFIEIAVRSLSRFACSVRGLFARRASITVTDASRPSDATLFTFLEFTHRILLWFRLPRTKASRIKGRSGRAGQAESTTRRRISTAVPSPGVESTRISAPQESTMRLTMASPRPVPLLRVEKCGSKIRSI